MYLTIKDVSQLLQVRPSTLYAWAEQGAIPHLKLGRLLRFDPEEIEAWIHDQRRNPAPAPTPRRRRQGPDHVDDLIAQAKREVYTPFRGKPDQDRATRKGENDGSV